MKTFDFVIHAGTHKTGTSSIQESFRGTKIENLTYLPWGPKDQHNVAYAMAFCDAPDKTLKRLAKGATLEDAVQAQQDARAALRQCLEDAPDGRVLISAEGIANSEKESVQAFYDVLKEYARSIRVIVYVRPPLNYGASALQQSLKQGKLPILPLIFKFKHKLEKFDDVFGADNVTICEFDRAKLHRGDVVFDIASKLGVAPQSIDLQRQNDAISQEICGLLSVYFETTPPHEPRPLISRKSRLFGHFFRGIGDTKIQLSRSLLELATARTREDVEWLKTRAGIDFSVDGASEQTFGEVAGLEDLYRIGLAQTDKFTALLRLKIPELAKVGADDMLAEVDACQTIEDPMFKLSRLVHIGRDLAGQYLAY